MTFEMFDLIFRLDWPHHLKLLIQISLEKNILFLFSQFSFPCVNLVDFYFLWLFMLYGIKAMKAEQKTVCHATFVCLVCLFGLRFVLGYKLL